MNANDESDAAYITALGEYEELESSLTPLEDELEDFQDTLAGLEQDQIWDD